MGELRWMLRSLLESRRGRTRIPTYNTGGGGNDAMLWGYRVSLVCVGE
jgi:hypothetical protein